MDFLLAILRPSYWYTHQHPVPESWLFGLMAFFGLVVVVGVVATVLSLMKKGFKKPWRTFFAKLAIWGWVMGIWGLVLLFFSKEQVAFLSARGLYLIWLAVAVWWVYYVIRYVVKDVPRLLQSQQERVEAEKYLPKKKK